MVPWEDEVVAALEAGQRHSMVGPGDVRAHVRHARRLGEALDPPARALDLGSGAGIPGLVLAGLWPHSAWVLLDAAQRRVRLVEGVVDRLGWAARIEVRHGRAEDLGRDLAYRGQFDLVTARLFGPPGVTAECGAPFLRVGGVLAVTEPPASTGDRWPPDDLEGLGLRALPPEPGLQRLVSTRPAEARYPRRAGIPERRPLF